LKRVALREDSAIMMFTDGLTERRPAPHAPRLGYSDLVPRIDATEMLTAPPGQAIDRMLARLFPQGTDQLEDDLSVILVNLKRATLIAAPPSACGSPAATNRAGHRRHPRHVDPPGACSRLPAAQRPWL
jgi:hypothetical protein